MRRAFENLEITQGQYRLRQEQTMYLRLVRLQDVALWPDRAEHRHHDFLAEWIDRWIRYLIMTIIIVVGHALIHAHASDIYLIVFNEVFLNHFFFITLYVELWIDKF